MRVGLLPRLCRRNASCLKLVYTRPDLRVSRHTRLILQQHITSSNRLRQDGRARKQQAHLHSPPADADSIKPESYSKPKEVRSDDDAPKSDAFLSERTVSTKEQRQADWAIMKEMACYLWPKVGSICQVCDTEKAV